jgi:hypothetical protein
MRFRSDNGSWLTAENGGGINGDSERGPARPDALVSDRTDKDVAQFGFAWQDFTLVTNDDKTVSLQIGNWFVTAERGGGGAVSTDRDVNGPWQRFTMETSNGAAQFLCSDGVHYLKVRTDLPRPFVDATGKTQGSRFRPMDPAPTLVTPPVVGTTTVQAPGSVRTSFSKAQLADLQTNLMLFIGDVPELAPHFDAGGFDPVLRMRNRGDNGATPNGIVSGQWMWTTTLPNYPKRYGRASSRRQNDSAQPTGFFTWPRCPWVAGITGCIRSTRRSPQVMAIVSTALTRRCWRMG